MLPPSPPCRGPSPAAILPSRPHRSAAAALLSPQPGPSFFDRILPVQRLEGVGPHDRGHPPGRGRRGPPLGRVRANRVYVARRHALVPGAVAMHHDVGAMAATIEAIVRLDGHPG